MRMLYAVNFRSGMYKVHKEHRAGSHFPKSGQWEEITRKDFMGSVIINELSLEG